MASLVTAKAKGINMTPRKVGEVASLIRGRSVNDAITILEHTPRRSALPLKKVIESARANAVHNHNVIADTLQLAELHVSPGPRMKRYRPIARGSAHPFQKRSTHITVVVSGSEKPKAKTAVKAKSQVKKGAK